MAAGGPLYLPKNAKRPYDTAIGIVSCEQWLLHVTSGLSSHHSCVGLASA